MKHYSCEPWPALAVLLLTAVLWDSCSAGISLLLCSSFDTLPFPPISLNTYVYCPPTVICSLKMKGHPLASPKKHKELELINANENY